VGGTTKEISKENSAAESYDVKELLVDLVKENKALRDSIMSIKEDHRDEMKDERKDHKVRPRRPEERSLLCWCPKCRVKLVEAKNSYIWLPKCGAYIKNGVGPVEISCKLEPHVGHILQMEMAGRDQL
jgi:hypothetical protein